MQKVKVKGHSVQKLEWKRTDRRTEAIALPTVLTRSVIKQEGLAVASIARDDPPLFPAMIPFLAPACTATAMRGKLGSEFET